MACGKSRLNCAIVHVGQICRQQTSHHQSRWYQLDDPTMAYDDQPYIKLVNLATNIGTGWGLTPKQVSAMFGREMASDHDKIEWSLTITENRIADVEERALKISELKIASR